MGLSTGIELLDNMTYGMMPGNIWVCGAYYGYGKTYLAINMINKALEDGKRVLFFSLEMPATAVIQRIIGLRAGLNNPEVVGMLSEYKKKIRDKAKDFVLKCISDGMLIIDDQLRSTDSILGRLMMLEKANHIDLTVVDYVQLLADGRDQYEALREATKNIQSVTKQTKTTTLLLSQVNNQAQRDGANSMVDGFKGAGDIGQIADVALKIERERNVNTGQFSDSFILRVTKVRHNQPGNIKCKISFPGGKITQDNSTALADTEEEFDNFLVGK
jgi:replicative DNA helicase